MDTIVDTKYIWYIGDNVKWIIGVIISILAIIVTIVSYLLKKRDNTIKKLEQKLEDKKHESVDHPDGKQLEGNNNPKDVGQSWHDVNQAVTEIVRQITQDKFVPSIIVGIGRGGGIFGSFISYRLYHTPIFVVDREYDRQSLIRTQNELFDFDIPACYLDRILLVAGEAHTGNTLGHFVEHLRRKGAGQIKTCVYYNQSVSNYHVDYFGTKGGDAPFMPWQCDEDIRDSIDKENLEKLQAVRQVVSRLEGKAIYIVRHGETDNNKNEVFIGVTPSELNKTGEKQISALADFLAKKEELKPSESVILTSDQERCLKTAQIINKSTGIMIDNDKAISQCLRERNYGQWEGKSRDVIKTTYPQDYKHYETDPLSTCPPGADPLLNIIQKLYRVIDKIEEMDNKKNGKNIIIVTHKTTGRLLLSYFTRSFYSDYRKIGFNNGSVSKFTVEKGMVKTQYLNRNLD